MGLGRGAVVATALAVVSLATASGAGAATEVGNDCLANGYASDFTLLQLERGPGASLPIATPSAGVVTRWKVDSGLGIVLAENLRVFRPTGNPGEFQVVADSSREAIFPGSNVFETRIPVAAGDRFGAFAESPSGALYCTPTNPADVMGAVNFNAAPGSVQTYASNPDYQVALSATVEPDADGDGYGDETQDGCPRSAAHQGECPRVTLTLRSAVHTQAILFYVKASTTASVMVFGQVGWDIPRRPAASAQKPGDKGRTIVGLSGGTKRIGITGARARFRIPLPKSVLRKLKSLSPAHSLRAKIAARSTDLDGRLGTKRLTVKLKGRNTAGS